jgi:cation-transporting ATPase E
VLGAFEALQPLVEDHGPAHAAWRELVATGWRLMLFARAAEAPRERFDGTLDGFRLRALALVALSDELRPEAPAVLRAFAEQGIAFKILSGDNPETVRATVAPLGQGADTPALAALAEGPVLAGTELENIPDAEAAILTHSVFGRVSPWQKVQIVRGLLAAGRKVAMIGDGVNDVLPIKNANLGIAMGDGSRAAKTVAGVVLKDNDFGLLPRLLDEGRIIVRNLRRSGKLFLNKNVYFLFLIIATIGIFHLPFPIAPQQVTLLNFLTIGVPALLITLDRRKAEAARGDFVGEVGGFALGTGIVTGMTALAMMLLSDRVWGDDVAMQRSMVLSTLVLFGWVTLYRALGHESGDRLLRVLPAAGQAVYVLAMYVPVVAEFFELVPLDAGRWAGVAGATVIAAGPLWVVDWHAAR